MPVDIKWLNDRYDQLYSSASNFRNLWRQVQNYFRVNADNIDSNSPPNPGQAATNYIFDSTPIDSLDKLTSFIWSNIAPQSAKWFIPTFGEEELQQNDALVDWIEKKGDQMLKQFRIDNFYAVLHQAIKDTASHGTGCVFIDEKPIKSQGFQGFDFKCIPCGTYVIAENFSGEVDTLMRKFPLTVKALMEFARAGKYGFKQARLPRQITQDATDNPDKILTVLHAAYPRTDSQQGMKGPLGYPWASVYAWEQNVLAEGGYQEFPYAVARFSVDPGDTWGRGLSFTALPDTIELNAQAQMRKKMIAKFYAPPTIGRDDAVVDGDVQNFAGGHTRISRTHMGPLSEAFSVLQTGEDISKMLLCEERLIASIQRIFFMDQIAALGATNNPQETATRTYIRWQLCHQMLGPAAGNMEIGLLQPIIHRAFNIMYRAGAFGEIPENLLPEEQVRKQGRQAKQASMSIRFDSPFARAQRAGDVEAFSRWIGRFAGMAQVYPEVLALPDIQTAMRDSAQIEGVPGSWVKDKDVVDKELANKKAQEQEDNMMGQAGGIAQAGGKIAPLLKAVPQLAQMMGGGQPEGGGK